MPLSLWRTQARQRYKKYIKSLGSRLSDTSEHIGITFRSRIKKERLTLNNHPLNPESLAKPCKRLCLTNRHAPKGTARRLSNIIYKLFFFCFIWTLWIRTNDQASTTLLLLRTSLKILMLESIFYCVKPCSTACPFSSIKICTQRVSRAWTSIR